MNIFLKQISTWTKIKSLRTEEKGVHKYAVDIKVVSKINKIKRA